MAWTYKRQPRQVSSRGLWHVTAMHVLLASQSPGPGSENGSAQAKSPGPMEALWEQPPYNGPGRGSKWRWSKMVVIVICYITKTEQKQCIFSFSFDLQPFCIPQFIVILSFAGAAPACILRDRCSVTELMCYHAHTSPHSVLFPSHHCVELILQHKQRSYKTCR